MTDFSFNLWFTVRYVHVAAAALLSGGAAAMTALSASGGSADSRAALALAQLYEWAFWSIAAVSVATGVSNLGLKGDALLGPKTTWGAALSVKIGAVVGLLALSVLRGDFVVRCVKPDGRISERGRKILASLYGLSSAILLGVLWMGLGLAHGRY